MGWSETSRFYYPSLFLAEHVYGTEYPWPILHPTLHLLLAPPYLFDASLWFHRFWQVAIRYILVAAIVPPLLMRLTIRGPDGALAGWTVDVPVPFHGTRLFSSRHPGHHRADRILSSRRTPELGRRYFGFHLVRMESCELVSHAGHDRRGAVSHGSPRCRETLAPLSAQACPDVRGGDGCRFYFTTNLYRSVGCSIQ